MISTVFLDNVRRVPFTKPTSSLLNSPTVTVNIPLYNESTTSSSSFQNKLSPTSLLTSGNQTAQNKLSATPTPDPASSSSSVTPTTSVTIPHLGESTSFNSTPHNKFLLTTVKPDPPSSPSVNRTVMINTPSFNDSATSSSALQDKTLLTPPPTLASSPSEKSPYELLTSTPPLNESAITSLTSQSKLPSTHPIPDSLSSPSSVSPSSVSQNKLVPPTSPTPSPSSSSLGDQPAVMMNYNELPNATYVSQNKLQKFLRSVRKPWARRKKTKHFEKSTTKGDPELASQYPSFPTSTGKVYHSIVMLKLKLSHFGYNCE